MSTLVDQRTAPEWQRDTGNCPHLSTGNCPPFYSGPLPDNCDVKDDVKILSDRVDARLDALGLSAFEASRRATGRPDLVRDIRRGRMPSAARLNALAEALETSVDYLLGGEGQAERPPRSLSYEPSAQADPRVADGIRGFRAGPVRRDLPILGSVMGSPVQFDQGSIPAESQLMDMGETVDHLIRPAGLGNVREAYALYIVGDSQSPRFEPGDVIFVNPRRPPAIGDDVVVQLRDHGSEQVLTALIKRLVRRTATHLELQQFNPATIISVPTANVHAIHRIMPLREIVGA